MCCRVKRVIFHFVVDLENIRGREGGKKSIQLKLKQPDLKKNPPNILVLDHPRIVSLTRNAKFVFADQLAPF